MSNDLELWSPPTTCDLCGTPIEGDAYHTLTDGSWADVCPDCYAREWFHAPMRNAPGTYGGHGESWLADLI